MHCQQRQFSGDGLSEAWYWLARETMGAGAKQGSRDGPTHELLGTTLVVRDPRDNVMHHPSRRWSPWYAAAETLWYLSGEEKIERVAAYAPSYSEYSDDGVTAHGAYGFRLKHPSDQIAAVIAMLRDTPDTRQAVMSTWRADDLFVALERRSRDIPCTLTLQFLLRSGKLHLVVNMRSNDIWLGLPYDAFAFTSIQQLVAAALGVDLGAYVHHSGSTHAYDRNADGIMECLREHREIAPRALVVAKYENVVVLPDVQEQIEFACNAEREMRFSTQKTRAQFRTELDQYLGPKSLLRDLVVACGVKLGRFEPSDLTSIPLMEACFCHAHSRGS